MSHRLKIFELFKIYSVEIYLFKKKMCFVVATERSCICINSISQRSVQTQLQNLIKENQGKTLYIKPFVFIKMSQQISTKHRSPLSSFGHPYI